MKPQAPVTRLVGRLLDISRLYVKGGAPAARRPGSISARLGGASSRACSEHLVVHGVGGGPHAVQRERVARPPRRRCAHAPAVDVIAQDAHERFRERGRVARLDQDAALAVAHYLGNAAHGRRHHWASGGHGFQERQAKPFPVRGQRHHVAGGQQAAHVAADPQPAHGAVNADQVRQRAQVALVELRSKLPPARQQQHGVRQLPVHALEGAQQQAVILLRVEPRRTQHHAGARLDAKLGTGARLIQVRERRGVNAVEHHTGLRRPVRRPWSPPTRARRPRCRW